jgi:hypothetical protein
MGAFDQKPKFLRKIKMSKILKLSAEIADARHKIWLDAPPELERIKSLQKGQAGNFAVRVYAFADAYRNQRNLWLLRDLVKNQNLAVATVKLLLVSFLPEMADRFDIWQLQTPARMFRKAENALESVESDDELAVLLDELLMYNNRWWLWLDSCIPWFELEKKI